MLGAIIGDVVGSRFEFNNTSRYDFEFYHKDCGFTDDTICTIAIADAVLNGKDYKDSLHEWCNKFPNPMGGYGGSFAQWVMSDSPKPYNSYGNGSAMRVAPVAWAYDDLEKVKEEAERTAMVTHNHPEGVKGAVAVAHAIHYLRTTHDIRGLENQMNQYYPRFMLADYFPGVFDETCMVTVPLCLKLVISSRSFEDAIRRAVAFGGDSDTIAAITGSMAEAMFGIPESMYPPVLDYLNVDMVLVIAYFFQMLNGRYNNK